MNKFVNISEEKRISTNFLLPGPYFALFDISIIVIVVIENPCVEISIKNCEFLC